MEEDYKIRNEKKETMIREWGRKLIDTLPEGTGFTILMYDYGKKGDLFYVSTANRQDTIKLMKEFIAKNEK